MVWKAFAWLSATGTIQIPVPKALPPPFPQMKLVIVLLCWRSSSGKCAGVSLAMRAVTWEYVLILCGLSSPPALALCLVFPPWHNYWPKQKLFLAEIKSS